MTARGFDYTSLFAAKVPDPVPRWVGFPKYNFIGGHNDPDQIPVEDLIAAATASLRREGRNLSLYTLGDGPLGHEGLRDVLSETLARRRGIRATRDEILLTIGSGQGIELIDDLLLEQGDTVLVEEFVYFGALTKLRKRGVKAVGIPLDHDGIRLDALRAILEDLKGRGIRPKYIYTIPSIQNPTGSILPLDRRHGLVALAREFGVPIFEDECYAELVWDGRAPPSLHALDPTGVIHIGSFSKTLAPSLRLGWIVAPWEVLSRLVALRSDGPGALEQLVVAEWLGKHFDDHLARLSATLRGKLDTMVDALEREFGSAAEIRRPDGGIYVWVKLPDEVDVRAVVGPAAAAGIAFNAGPVWAADPDAAKSYLRLCFALPSEAEIRDGIAALARVFHETTGVPARSANVRNATAVA